MRLFAIKDDADREGSVLSVLACYERTEEFYIDMPEGADPWTVPLILSSFAKRGRWTIGPDWSRRWVESRVVPASRQNLGEILRVNGLNDYDLLALLQMTEGRNSQDSCYLAPIALDEAPAWFAEREAHRVREAVALDGHRLLVAFGTGETRVYSSEDLAGMNDAVGLALGNVATFDRVEVSAGGRGIQWGTNVRIMDGDLLHAGLFTPLTGEDLRRVSSRLLIDTAEAAQILECTRQNVSQLVSRGSLVPAKASGKVTLFFRADVQRRLD